MESLPRKPEQEKVKPDQTGEQDTSKKRRKKSAKILKKTVGSSVVIPAEKDSADAPRRRLLAESAKEQKKEQLQPPAPKPEETTPQETSSEAEPILPPIELPEVALSDDKEFAGEIVIDHSETPHAEADEAAEPDEKAPVETASPEVTASSEASEPAETAPAKTSESASTTPEAEPVTTAETEPTEPAAEPEAAPEEPPRVAPPFMFTIPAERLRPAPETPEAEPTMPVAERPLAEPLRQTAERLRVQRAEATVPVAVAHEREYRAEKRGLSRGVVAGGFTGWWLGRRGNKELKREVKATRAELKDRDAKIEGLVRDRQVESETAKHRLSVIERTQAEMKKLMQRTWDNDVLRRSSRSEAPLRATRVVEVPAQPVPESAQPVFEPIREAFKPVYRPFEAAPQTAESMAAVRTSVAPEEARPTVQTTERVQQAEKPETPIEDRPITEETYLSPEGRRVEMSAWHRVEIDQKTGKAVEQPAVAYGEAFRQEQQQEKLAADAAKAQTAAQVGMTVLLGGTDETQTPLMPTSSAPIQKSNLVTQSLKKEAIQAARQIAQQSMSPLTWIVALALVVLLFLTGVLR